MLCVVDSAALNDFECNEEEVGPVTQFCCEQRLLAELQPISYSRTGVRDNAEADQPLSGSASLVSAGGEPLRRRGHIDRFDLGAEALSW